MQIFGCRLNDLPVLRLPFSLLCSVTNYKLFSPVPWTLQHRICTLCVHPKFSLLSVCLVANILSISAPWPTPSQWAPPLPPSSSPFFHPWLLLECVISQSPSNSDISRENIPVLDSSIPTAALYLFKTSGPVRISFPFIHDLLASFLSGST